MKGRWLGADEEMHTSTEAQFQDYKRQWAEQEVVYAWSCVACAFLLTLTTEGMSLARQGKRGEVSSWLVRRFLPCLFVGEALKGRSKMDGSQARARGHVRVTRRGCLLACWNPSTPLHHHHHTHAQALSLPSSHSILADVLVLVLAL